MGYQVRDYVAGDEPSWLRCRGLSFLGTAFHDPVLPAKPEVSGVELVAVDGAVVVGILDVAVAGDLATVDTLAVHPDHRHRGIGGALLSRARARAGALGATTLDAWTRDDPPTLRWYRAMGFTESDHYVHVIADHCTRADEPAGAVATVHVCRRFALALGGEFARRGDDVDHRAVAQDGDRQR